MPNEKPNTIKVSEAQHHEIDADHADLHVTVEGVSLFTGGEALTKAREVAQLVRALTEFGLPATDIYLQGIFADTSTGLLGKSSAARYKLRLRCVNLAQLADLIGIVMAQKNSRLNVIEWGYPDNDALKGQWLQKCITRANGKATQIAVSLGVRLLGVHGFSEKYSEGEAPQRTAIAEEGMYMARSRIAQVSGEELGMEISHTKKVQVAVEIEYLISAYEPTP